MTLHTNPFVLPQFIVEEGVFTLSAGSPAIDAGSSDFVGALDLAGDARLCGARTDIGAFEFGGCPGVADFVRGDLNGDAGIDIADALQGLIHVFVDSGLLTCLKSADTNDDGRVDLPDALATLRYLFAAGQAPAAPAESCGRDSSADELRCEDCSACDRL